MEDLAMMDKEGDDDDDDDDMLVNEFDHEVESDDDDDDGSHDDETIDDDENFPWSMGWNEWEKATAGEPRHTRPFHWQPQMVNGGRQPVRVVVGLVDNAKDYNAADDADDDDDDDDDDDEYDPSRLATPGAWKAPRQGKLPQTEWVNNVLVTYPLDLQCKRAYAPVPDKTPIRTIYGHVQIYSVLRRWRPATRAKPRNANDDENDWKMVDDGDEEEDEEGDEYDQDEGDNPVNTTSNDPIFVRTSSWVAIKVNLQQRMQRLAHVANEDPIKEIAAQQLVHASGANHVLSCRAVIFDNGTKTINVVLPFVRDGDLFDLIYNTCYDREQQQQNNADDPDDTKNLPPKSSSGQEKKKLKTQLGLPEEQAKHWFRQIIQGLMELRNLGLCHRDLSPENIMMDGNNVLIIDLGLSLRVPYYEEIAQEEHEALQKQKYQEQGHGQEDDEGERAIETILSIVSNAEVRPWWQRFLTHPLPLAGKLPYMAPELFFHSNFNPDVVANPPPFDGEVCDVWSAGIILFCMLTGASSYAVPHTVDRKFRQITEQIEQFFRTTPVSPAGLDLLKQMLNVNPAQRLRLQQVWNHEWLRPQQQELAFSSPPVAATSAATAYVQQLDRMESL